MTYHTNIEGASDWGEGEAANGTVFVVENLSDYGRPTVG